MLTRAMIFEFGFFRIQHALNAALETGKQAQTQTQEKQQQIIDLQHETREVLSIFCHFIARILGSRLQS